MMRYYLGMVCALCGFLLGRIEGLLIVLLVTMAVDWVTGLWSAAKSGSVSSKRGWLGIKRKIVILSIVAIANLIDVYAGLGGIFGGVCIRDLCIIFYITNELISITENCGELGVKIPDTIARAIESLHKQSEV